MRSARARSRSAGPAFITGLLDNVGVHLPHALKVGPQIQWGFLQGGEVGGLINLPAVIIVGLVTTLLVIGTKESATRQCRAGADQSRGPDPVPHHHAADDQRPRSNFHPFTPRGWGNPLSSSGTGMLGAAASIFFAYVGFDAVSTAAEETKNPQRNVPIGLIGCLLICTVFYLLVAGGVDRRLRRAAARWIRRRRLAFKEGSPELYASAACQAAHAPTGLLEGGAGARPARGRRTRSSAISSGSPLLSRCRRSCC